MSAIEVSGGAAGLSVGLDELEESARRLRSLALDLGEVAASIGLAATDPRLALAGLLARFRIRLPPGEPVMTAAIVTTQPDRSPAFHLSRR